MRLSTLTGLLLLLLSSSVFAQTSKIIDSIEKLLPAQKDTILVKSYNELTWQYRTVDRDKAIAYGNKAAELGKELNFKKGIAQAYNDMGILYYDKQDFAAAIKLYNQAFQIRSEMKDDKGVAALYNKIGIVYQKEGHYDSALLYAQKALSLYETLKDKIGISYSLNNMGIVNQNMGNIDEALKYQEQSIAIKEEIHDQLGLAGSYVNVGNIYLLKKDMPKARELYEKAEAISRKIGDPEYLANSINNLSTIYQRMGDYKKSLPLAQESFDIRSKLGDTKGQVSCLINMGSLLTNTKQYKLAEEKYLLGLKLADTLQSCLPEKVKVYDGLAALYTLSGDYRKSAEMARLTIQYKDSIFTADLNKQFSEMETKYQTAKKDEQIQLQQNEITQKKYELIKKQYWLYGSIAVFLFSLLLAFSYYKRYQLKQEKKLQAEVMKQQDMATKAVIAAEENERKRIAADLHDGVGQMMSAAKMNLSAFENDIPFKDDHQKTSFEKIIGLVDESCKEIRSVSHQMMPNALLKSGLASAIKEFIDKIDTRVLKVNLHTEGLNERLDSNVETVLYRVIQECVNNVIKHSGANTLDISLIKDADGIAATIEDNGRGFDSKDKEKFEGIGLKNIKTRIGYLKGTVDFDTSPGNGTLVAIHVPLV
ncbi:MAG: tetratricopeptide repeat protein [Bacteroidetes bacterium]|nr:tetratricopeptide repeat protein [Bacteroidota bacterium]